MEAWATTELGAAVGPCSEAAAGAPGIEPRQRRHLGTRLDSGARSVPDGQEPGGAQDPEGRSPPTASLPGCVPPHGWAGGPCILSMMDRLQGLSTGRAALLAPNTAARGWRPPRRAGPVCRPPGGSRVCSQPLRLPLALLPPRRAPWLPSPRPAPSLLPPACLSPGTQPRPAEAKPSLVLCCVWSCLLPAASWGGAACLLSQPVCENSE